jgi:hypothetical protein
MADETITGVSVSSGEKRTQPNSPFKQVTSGTLSLPNLMLCGYACNFTLETKSTELGYNVMKGTEYFVSL